MGIIWTVIIGFLAGVIAKFLMPGDNEPSGFILTTILGIVGAFVATFQHQHRCCHADPIIQLALGIVDEDVRSVPPILVDVDQRRHRW